MTPESQRIAIAEACGWKLQDDEWIRPENHDVEGFRDEDGCWHDVPPDYLNSLDAMHEAEKVLSDVQAWDYGVALSKITQSMNFHFCHATAAQRAEAFLRTLGLWKS